MSITLQAIALGNDDTRPAEFATANEQLNEVYKKILEKMSSSEQIEVRKSQRAWIIFRDLDCAWAYLG